MADTVFISEYLAKTHRGKPIAQKLKEILGSRLETVPKNKNEWCRDYMPVKASDGSLVLFKYTPSYIVGRKSYEATIPENREDICKTLGLEFETSDIILDGGAIEIFGHKAIISDRVIADNCSLWKNEAPIVLQEIKRKLKLQTLIVVPSDPWDFTGHVDGMVRFIDGERVLVNQLDKVVSNMDKLIKEGKSTALEKEMFIKWKENFEMTLRVAELEIKTLPCELHHNSDDKSARGIYLNYLNLDDMIIVPEYSGKEYDDANKEVIKTLVRIFRNKEIKQVKADELSKEGGVINCVTWAY